ncbi:MAG: ABA4-like family protein [Sphingomicrobium sp.]
MSWDGIFGLTNAIAMLGWLLVIVGPRGQKTLALVLYLGVGLLCFAYAAMIVGMHAGMIDANRLPGAPPPNFLDYNVAGLRNLFMSDGGVVLGWTHYLAFDLFVGQWIAKDADNKGFHRLVQAPILLLTLLVGPVGLLVWLALRDRRARRAARG